MARQMFQKGLVNPSFPTRICMELMSRNCMKNGKRLVKSLNGLVVTDFRLMPTIHGSVRFAHGSVQNFQLTRQPLLTRLVK